MKTIVTGGARAVALGTSGAKAEMSRPSETAHTACVDCVCGFVLGGIRV